MVNGSLGLALLGIIVSLYPSFGIAQMIGFTLGMLSLLILRASKPRLVPVGDDEDDSHEYRKRAKWARRLALVALSISVVMFMLGQIFKIWAAREAAVQMSGFESNWLIKAMRRQH